jgi:hypothetical protein
MAELFSLMNLVDPDNFNDAEAFLVSYGDPPRHPSTPTQMKALQVRPVYASVA